MGSVSVATRSVALSSLERKAGRKRRTMKQRRGDAYPIENSRKGGAKKSKRKGASFEKQIAKLFAAYAGCSVRRTPGSGGWATVGDFGPKGDLVFAIRKMPYHVECKKQEGWDLTDLLTGLRAIDKTSTNSIEKWWAQTIRDCPRRKVAMLIFARNMQKVGTAKNMGVPPLLMMRQTEFQKLGTVVKNGTAIWCASDFIPHIAFANDTEVRIVCLLSDFFKYVKPPRCSPRRKMWKRGVG